MAERQRQYYAEQAQKEAKRKEKEAKKRGETLPDVTTETSKPTSTNTPQPTTPSVATPAPAKPSTSSERATDMSRQIEVENQRAAQKAQAEREKQAREQARQLERERVAREKAERKKASQTESAAPTPTTIPALTPAPAPDTREATRQRKETERQQAEQTREAAKLERETIREMEKAKRRLGSGPAVGEARPNAARPNAARPNAARPDTIAGFGPRKQFLPKDHLFAPIILDPLQSQTYGSVLPLFYVNGDRYKGSIVPFAFGIQKPFFRRQTGTNRASEWALDVASFTQFEVYQDEKVNKQRRQLVNTDYRVGISYHLRRGPGTWRFRAYHLSSHLGDDYIIRNQLNFRLPNSVNYELIDATYSRQVRDLRVYGGVGVGLRVSEERKPLSLQAGFWYKKPSTKAAQLVGGLDMKLWQQTDFRPGIKAGVGVTAGRGPNNLTFLLETYSGFRPYSLYETDKVFWLGFGVYLQPF